MNTRYQVSFRNRLALGLGIAGLSIAASPVFAADAADSGADQYVQFSPVSVARTPEQKRQVRATSGMSIVGGSQAAGNTAQHSIGFETILRSGQRAGDYPFGAITDSSGKPVLAEDGSMTISDSNDFSSLLRHDGQMFMVSHFEARPGAMYVTKLSQDPDSGQLSAVSTRPVDFSGVNGLWVPCAGSVTPWGTHLGGEEYEPDARTVDASTGGIDSYYNAMGAYITGSYATEDQGLTQLNPYDYGYPTEIAITSADGDVDVAKHYSMGRKANELAYVMPDEKTVYSTDDGTNTSLYMFIADQAGDLSAGTLYAMKWNQTSAANGGRANLDWVNLGHATDQQIAGYLGKDGSPKLTFSDIFDTAEVSETGPICPSDFTAINANGVGPECLQVKPGMDRAASRLETRRYAAIQGATTEIRKEEGFTFDPNNNQFYVAISERQNGMEDFSENGNESQDYDLGTSNDIRLPYNICGTVYSGQVGRDEAIGSDYVAKNIAAEVSGTMTTAIDPESSVTAYAEDSDLANNACDVDGIANPDNVTYMPGYNTLIIGEDSSEGHQNDMVWSYNTQSKELTRIETTPYGSESTSIYFYPEYNGFGYLMSVVQHPYGESDSDKLQSADQNKAYTGYLGPFPAMNAAAAPQTVAAKDGEDAGSS